MTREEYEAVLKARGVIYTIAPKSTFGRGVTLSESGWDPIKQRSIIGVYNSGLMLEEPSNIISQQQFINDSCEFLNKLNESFKVPGYHINMTNDLDGVYYIGKDSDDNNLHMISKRDEYNGFEEAAYRHYLLNKSYLQDRLKQTIQEAMILVDESLSYEDKTYKLQSLNEGLGDSLSDAWDKFKAFLNKIWLKFNEFISRTVNSDRAYLTKYKEIIQKREYKVEGISIEDDYHVGITRISQYMMYTPSVGDLDQFPGESNDQNLDIVRKKVFPSYQGGIEFADFCKTYFLGGTGKAKELNGAEVNLNEMYSFCYNYEKITKVLNKNKVTLDNAIAPFEQALKEKIQAANQQAQPGASVGGGNASIGGGNASVGGGNASIGGGNSNPQPHNPPNSPITGASKAADGIYINGTKYSAKKDQSGAISSNFTNYNLDLNAIKNKPVAAVVADLKSKGIIESARFYNTNMGRILHEAISQAGSTTGGGSPSASQYNARGNVAVRTGAASQYGQNGAGNTLKDEQVLRTKLSMFQSTASTIFAAMCTAAQTIKKDFMTIIKKHVQSYLGAEDAEGKTGVQTLPTYTTQNIAAFNNLTRVNDDLASIQKWKGDQKAHEGEIAQLLAKATKDTEVPMPNDPNTKAPSITFTTLDDYERFLNEQKKKVEDEQNKKNSNQQNPPANP